MAVKKNLRYTRGDTMLRRVFRLYVSDEPMDITEARAHVRVRQDRDAQLIFDLPVSHSGNAVTVGEGFKLEGEPGSYFWDLEVIYNDGGSKTLTPIEGKFELTPDVTYVEEP